MKWLAAVVAAIVAVLVAAGVFGPNLVRGRVALAAGRALHRDVAIGSMTLLPSWPPTLQASDVTVAGLGSVPRVQAELATASLLSGQPAIRQISLLRPSLTIASDEGRIAPLLKRAVSARPRAAAGAAPRTRPRLVIQDGRVILHDPSLGPDMTVAVSGTRDGAAYDLALQGTIPSGTDLPFLAGAVVTAHLVSGQPVHATLNGNWRGQPVAAAIDGGTPEAIAAGHLQALTLTVTGAGATLRVSGGVGDVARRSGIDIAVSLRADDERQLAALLGWPQAAPGAVSLDAHVTGTATAFALHDIDLRAPQGDAAGDLSVLLGRLPTLRGTLHVKRLDLDAVLAALAAPPPPLPPRPQAAAPAATPPPPPSPWLIPDRPLPFAALFRADTDVLLTADVLRFGGVDYRNLAGHVVLRGGRLAVAPFSAELPGNAALQATLHADAAASPPTAALTLHAPAVALAPLLAALQAPATLAGAAALDADVRGEGATPHALAASLSGTAGLHLIDGDIGSQVFTDLLRAARLPLKLPPGETRLRCAAIGFTATGGVLDVDPLVADADRLRIEGAGSVDLGHETLALELQPLLRAGPGLVIPVQLSGSWRTPKVAIGRGSGTPASAACPAGVASPGAGKKHPKPIDLLRSLLR